MENSTEFSKETVIKAVMDSGVLGASKHQILLFKYLINSKYNNELEGMKAYRIAIDAFSRSADFDSSSDSIVRVEMFRLRANLRSFNQSSNDFHLELPKASYDIQIKPLVEAKIGESEAIVTKKQFEKFGFGTIRNLVMVGITLGIGLFLIARNVSGWTERTNCSDTIPNIAIASADEASDLELYVEEIIRGAASQYSHFNIVKDVKACRDMGTPGYELQYTIFQDENLFRGTLKATSDIDNQLVVTQNFSGKLKNGTLSSDILNDEFYFDVVRITNNLLRPLGIIHKNTSVASWEDDAKRENYGCLLRMYDSFVSDSDKAYKDGLNCLEMSYKSGTPSLDNLGGLAASYIEQAQNIRQHSVEDPLDSAISIMDDVGEKWPLSVETTVAKIMLEAEREDYNSQRLGSTLYRAEQIYESNPLVLGEIAKYSGFKLGNWDYAKTISARANRLTSERDNSSYLIDAAYALIFDNSKNAMAICAKAYSENSKVANLLVNACAMKANNTLWTERTENNLRRLGLETIPDRVAFLKNLEFDEKFNQAILDSWKINL